MPQSRQSELDLVFLSPGERRQRTERRRQELEVALAELEDVDTNCK